MDQEREVALILVRALGMYCVVCVLHAPSGGSMKGRIRWEKENENVSV